MIKNPESFPNNQEPAEEGGDSIQEELKKIQRELESPSSEFEKMEAISKLGEITSEGFKQSRKDQLKEMGNLTDDEIERMAKNEEDAFKKIEAKNKQKN